MKFVCDRCSTRYSISDEKVRGKVLKIRCKTCSNIIVVREQMAESASSASQGAAAAGGGQGAALRGPAPRTAVDIPRYTAPVAPSDANTEWWVAIKGTQHGPMKKRELERLYEEGRISARSYCWNDSLPSWTRLQELPDFQDLLQREPGERRPPPPPPSEEGGAEVVDLQKARAERQTPAREPAAPVNDPFAAAAAASGSADVSARPGEATRVFIMQAGLANRKAKHRTYAGVALVAVVLLLVGAWGDWVGYWEIPGLHSAISYAAETTGVEVPQQRLLASWDDVKPDLEEKCQLHPGDPECQTYLAEKAAYLRKARSRGKKAETALNLDDAFQTGGPGGGDGLRRAGTDGDMAAVDPFGSNRGEASAIANVFATDGKKRAAAPVAKLTDAPVVAGGTGPDAEAIGKVVRDNAGAVKSCIEQGAKTGSTVEGKHYLVITVEPRGTVSNAYFKNGVVNASPVGECIRNRARRWKFPAFVGEAADIEIPYILSTGT